MNNWSYNAGQIVLLLALLGVAIAVIGRPSRSSLLIKAAKNGDLTYCESLLRKGANVNYARKNDGKTPLIAATISDKPEIVALLLKNGANIRIRDTSGKSALDYAQDLQNPKLLLLLKAAQ